MSEAHQPFIKWYPTDWRADPRLRMCSLAARGLWIDLIGYMHEGAPYGHLTINDAVPTLADITALVGRPMGEVRKAMSELEARQVYSVDGAGRMFSRRMVRDKAKAEKDRENGKGGGNPKLKGGVNPPDKAQIPEARYQKPDQDSAAKAAAGAEAPIDHRKRLFDEGLKKLAALTGKGPDACRSFVGKCLKSAGDDAVTVLGLIEEAERNRVVDPSAWIAACLKSKESSNGRRTVHDAARDLDERVRALDDLPPQLELRDGTGQGVVRLLPAR